jgi:GT2 family glycosyltransferase
VTRRTIYDQLGGLDERFVMFSEEMEWCKRIRDAGWQAVYLGTARIVHHGGKSTAQVPAFKHIYFQQSKLRYFAKHHGLLAAGILRTFLIASYAAQIIVEAGKGLIGHKRALRQQRVELYTTVIRALADPSFVPQFGNK